MMAVQSQKARQTIGIRMAAPDEPISDAQILVEPSALQQQIGHDLLRSAVTRSNGENRLDRLEGAGDIAQLDAQHQHLHQYLRSPISHRTHR